MPIKRNKKTGEVWLFDDNGNPVRRIDAPAPPQQGAIPIGPRNTDRARQAQNDAISQANDAERLRLAQDAAARAAAAERRAQEAADRQAREWEATHNADGTPKKVSSYRPMPDGAAKRYEDSVSSFANLDRAISTFKSDYAGNTITGGLENTIQRRFNSFGTEGQAQWWADVNATDNALRNALFGASLTAGEQAAWDRTSIDPSMDPAQVKRNLEQRREIARGALSRKTAFLKANGYDPNAVNALAGEYAQNLSGQNIPPVANAMDQTYFQQDQREAVGFGADMRQTQVPPEMQAEWRAYMEQNHNGQMDPDAYARFRVGLEQKYGYAPDAAREQLYREEAQMFNDSYNSGQRTVAPIPGRMEKMSTLDVLKNSFANNPVTVTAANAADAATLGIPSLLDRTIGPGNMELLNNANPNSALLGQVAGSIAGTSGLGAAGKAITAKLAPKLLGGEGGAALTRGIINDAAYSGIYGANQGADPLESTLAGAVGSAAGRGVGKTLGTVVGGVDMSPALARLRSVGVTPTIGQIMRGKANPGVLSKLIAGAEDVAANNGISGSVVNAARTRGLAQADNAAFNTVAGDAGRVEGFGLDAVNQLDNIKGAAYSDATQGVNIPLDDPRFIQQLGAARDRGLAQDFARSRGDFALSTNQGLAPIFGSGEAMNGRQLQDALRFVQGEQRAWNKASNGVAPDPSARGLASAFKDIEDSLIGAAARNAPGAIPKLKKANRINRGLSVLDNAVPPNGEELFTGAQLMNAIRGNNSKLGSGRGIKAAQNSPLFRLASDMQAVLPNKIPPTGVNAAPALALMGLGSSGLGYATDNSTLGGFGAALLATTPYTRKGSEALAKMLIDRPESIKALGAAINKRKGLFGAATIPLMLETQN